LPLLNAGNKSAQGTFQSFFTSKDPVAINIIEQEIDLIYDSLHLKKKGLKKEAFKYAYSGYKKLEEEGKLDKEGILTICDMSQSSKR
ncbi:MAG TPA: hypothetical protein VFH08_16105, partial [Chitinophagaceae bacterium]|nr:hypothetical protein [Chitinophagaceae bacterium]